MAKTVGKSGVSNSTATNVAVEFLAVIWVLTEHLPILQKIGIRNLFFVSDGIAFDIQKRISVTPVLGKGNALIRAQMVIDKFQKDNPNATISFGSMAFIILPSGVLYNRTRCSIIV